eukprot:3473586-Rhodomonas_salina.8
MPIRGPRPTPEIPKSTPFSGHKLSTECSPGSGRHGVGHDGQRATGSVPEAMAGACGVSAVVRG